MKRQTLFLMIWSLYIFNCVEAALFSHFGHTPWDFCFGSCAGCFSMAIQLSLFVYAFHHDSPKTIVLLQK